MGESIEDRMTGLGQPRTNSEPVVHVRSTFNPGNSASECFAAPCQPHSDPPSEHAPSCDTEQNHTDDRDNPRKVGPATVTGIALRGSPYTH